MSAIRTKVKVQVGGGINSASKDIVASKERLPQDLSAAFPQNDSRTLAELCDSHFIFRQKRKATGKDIFPTSGVFSKLTKTSKGKRSNLFQGHSETKRAQTDMGPRVEIIDGKIVLKESSLEITANDEMPINEDEYEEVEEGAMVSSRYSSFLNKRSSRQWGIEETRIFYNALRQCGTDFSLMQTILPNRTRKELKMKFFREEKQHPELVKSALQSSLPLELTPFEVILGESINDISNVASEACSSPPLMTT